MRETQLRGTRHLRESFRTNRRDISDRGDPGRPIVEALFRDLICLSRASPCDIRSSPFLFASRSELSSARVILCHIRTAVAFHNLNIWTLDSSHDSCHSRPKR